MSDEQMFKAVKQYETFGKITPCKHCTNYNYKESVKGYGVCAVFGRMMKENEFCCYGKERESEEWPCTESQSLNMGKL